MFKFLQDIDVAKRKLLNTINNKLALPNGDDECLFQGDEPTMSGALGAGERSLLRRGESSEEDSGQSDEGDASQPDEGDASQPDEGDASQPDEGDASQPDEGDGSQPGEDNSSEPDEDSSSQSDEDDSFEPSGDAKGSARSGCEEEGKREEEAVGVAAIGAADWVACRRKKKETRTGQSRRGSEVSTEVGAIRGAHPIRGRIERGEHGESAKRGSRATPRDEVAELRRRNKILNDINERQTKQLLQLSCQLSSNIKSDSEGSERNYISAKVDAMERQLTQLKGEIATLEELASDKNAYVKKSYELGCLIKSLEGTLKEKSLLCVSLWREKLKLQQRLQRCRQQVQLSKEDLRACRMNLLHMQRGEKRLAFQFRGLVRSHGDRVGGIPLQRHRRKGRLKLKLKLKLRGGGESGACDDSEGAPPSVHPNGVYHPNSVYPPRRTSSADPTSHTISYSSGGANCRAEGHASRDSPEELARKVNRYKFVLGEWKSLSVRRKKKEDAELKETKKLLSQQVAKNEMLERNNQTLLERVRSLDRGAQGGGAVGSGMDSHLGNGMINRQEGDHPQTKELLDEVNFLAREVERLREDQLLLQEDVKKKSTIIVHLIKKHALSEEHFRLDSSLPILKNQLTYAEMRKIMEETLVENIRLRSDLATLAKCVKGDGAGQDNPRG
ncbi:conserved Plasmodium protein, unknown function [Plasmodium vivax]|nr:conserved Plasmodium protein, unknown function [Plasmodium vivax]